MGPVSFRRLSAALFLGQGLVDALLEGDLKGVNTALAAGADPNLVLPEHGVAPVHLAAGAATEEFGASATEALLAAGGDPNLPSGDGEAVTPLHVAAAWGRKYVVQRLLDAGGDPCRPDSDGLSATQYAARENRYSVLQVINGHQKSPPKRKSPSQSFSCYYYAASSASNDSSLPGDLALNRNALTLLQSHRRHAELYESLPGKTESQGPANIARPGTPPTANASVYSENHPQSLTTFCSHHKLLKNIESTKIIHKTVPKKTSNSRSPCHRHCTCMTERNMTQANNYPGNDLLSDVSDSFSNEILFRYLITARRNQLRQKKRLGLSRAGSEHNLQRLQSEEPDKFSKEILHSFLLNRTNENKILRKNYLCFHCQRKKEVVDKIIQTDNTETTSADKSIQANFQRPLIESLIANKQIYNPELRKVLNEVTEKIVMSESMIEKENSEEFTYDPGDSTKTSWKLGWNNLKNISNPSVRENSNYPRGENSSANIKRNNSSHDRKGSKVVCALVTETELEKSGCLCNKNGPKGTVRHFHQTSTRHSPIRTDRKDCLAKAVSLIWDVEEFCSDPDPWFVAEKPTFVGEPSTYSVEGKSEHFKDQFTSFNVVRDEEHITGTKAVQDKISPSENKNIPMNLEIRKQLLKDKLCIKKLDKQSKVNSQSNDFTNQMALASQMVSEIVSSLKPKEVNLSLNGVTVNVSPDKCYKDSKVTLKSDHKRIRERFSSKHAGNSRRKSGNTPPRSVELSQNKRSKAVSSNTFTDALNKPKEKNISSTIREQMDKHPSSLNGEVVQTSVESNLKEKHTINSIVEINLLEDRETNTEYTVKNKISYGISEDSNVPSNLIESTSYIKKECVETIPRKHEMFDEWISEKKLVEPKDDKKTADSVNTEKPTVGEITVTVMETSEDTFTKKINEDFDKVNHIDIDTVVVSENLELQKRDSLSLNEYKMAESLISYSLYQSTQSSVIPIDPLQKAQHQE